MIFDCSLQMKMIKGSGQIRKLCYCCHEDEEHSRYIMPTGLLLTRIVNGKFMQVTGYCQSVISRLHSTYQYLNCGLS